MGIQERANKRQRQIDKIIVWNVLFKGVEKNPSSRNWARAFGSYQEAEDYMGKWSEREGLKPCSTMGWLKTGYEGVTHQYTVGAMNDWRMEDDDGNSYYFVIHVQEVLYSVEEQKKSKTIGTSDYN